MQLTVLDHRCTNGDSRVHIAVPRKITDRAAVHAALDRFQFVDDLHRTDFRRTRQRACRQYRTQGVHRRQTVLQLAGDIGHDVHHVGVTLDHHFFGEFDRTNFRDPPRVIAPQVDQHQVFSNFLVITEQVLLQRQIRLFGRTPRTRPGNRAHGDQIIFNPHQHFRRAAHHVEVAKVEEVHIRRRVEAAQRAIQIDRRGLEIDGHPLRRHHLHAIARENVILDGIDGFLVVALGKTGTEYRVGCLLGREVQAAARRNRLTQLLKQCFKSRLPLFVRTWLCRIDQHNRVHLACEVVEHHHGIGHHQQDIRHAQRIRVRALAQTFFHVPHTVITEVAHQPAVETRQPGNGRHVVTGLEGFDKRQRIFGLAGLDLDTVVGHTHLMVVHAQYRAARQTDDRITPPLLAALHRLQQIGVGLVGQFQVDGQRRVKVGKGFAGKRDTVIAGSGQTQEFFTDHEVPRGLRVKQSGMQTCRISGQIQVRRANANGPGP